jgi:hypothetical protein
LKNNSGLAEYGSTPGFFRNIIPFHLCYAALFGILDIMATNITAHRESWLAFGEYVVLRTKPLTAPING